jgi:hypothetical protein
MGQSMEFVVDQGHQGLEGILIPRSPPAQQIANGLGR